MFTAFMKNRLFNLIIKLTQFGINMANLVRTNSDDADFRKLVVLLDEDLQIRDGAEHAFYAQFNKIDKIRHVVVAYEDEKAVGCGAFREYSANTAEIKRMFVLPEHRKRGIAGQILTELENWVRESDYTECILETGINQPEAIGFYKKNGYEEMASYGQYLNVENSICMRKLIV